jgi:DNA mismatch repair protein MutS2
MTTTTTTTTTAWLLQLLLLVHVQAFSVPDYSTRAGLDGFSLTRQPVSWELNRDPVFDVPLQLDESNSNIADSEWWDRSNSREKQSVRRRRDNETTTTTTIAWDALPRTFSALDFEQILQALAQQCTLHVARTWIQQAISEQNVGMVVATSHQQCLAQYQAVQEVNWLLNDGSQARTSYYHSSRLQRREPVWGRPPPLGGKSWELASLVLAAPSGRVLGRDEIQELAELLRVLQDLQQWSASLSDQFTELPRIVSTIQVNETLSQLVTNALDPDTGLLSGTAFPSIGQLRARVRSEKANILSTLKDLLALPSIASKLATESGGALISQVVSNSRLVIPLDAAHYTSSMGLVHESSRSGKTLYVEPTEIVGATDELRRVEQELRAQEARIWRLLTTAVVANRASLQQSLAAVAQLDLATARFQLGQSWQGVIPVVDKEGVVLVRNARHPILMLRQVPTVVGSDLDFGRGDQCGLVLTGPNSGGKTVILKLLGLLALLVRTGIPVPVQDRNVDGETTDNYIPRVDYFDPILADIGSDIQSVGDLSTFQGHMLVCREILSQAGPQSLVLMDEVGSGTDPAQGVAIAQAVLEALVDQGARVAITTHYLQLKQLAAADRRFGVAGMEFVAGRPTYRLLAGTVGESFALTVAERMKIPAPVLARANELLDSETRQMGDLIQELEDQKATMDQQSLELQAKRKDLLLREAEMKEQLAKLEQKQLNVRREEARKFAQKLEEKERVLDDILDKLKSDPSRRVVAKSWDEIKLMKREAFSEAENIPSIVAGRIKAAAHAEELQQKLVPISEMNDRPSLNVGGAVVVCRKGPLLGREGVISKVMGRNQVEVNVNNMNISFKLDEISLKPAAYVPPAVPVFAGQMGGERQRGRQVSSISKSAERALASEGAPSATIVMSQTAGGTASRPSESSSSAFRTASNTVDVRGCSFEQAKDKARDKFSRLLMDGRSNVVYILHGYGTGGVLRSKIRAWLQTEQQRGTMVKKWHSADSIDGGDSFTRVELK